MSLKNEAWYKEIANALENQVKNKVRLEVIKKKMLGQEGPRNRLIAQYGDITERKSIEDLELEYKTLESITGSIEKAFDCLTEMERKIIELKFIEQKKDVIVYQVYLPMSTATYYKYLKSAMMKLKDVLY